MIRTGAELLAELLECRRLGKEARKADTERREEARLRAEGQGRVAIVVEPSAMTLKSQGGR